MKKIITKISATISAYLVINIPLAFAATTIENPLKGAGSISGFVTTILGYVVKIGGVIAIFAFIWAGFLFVRAQGNPAELEKARNVFINTCIGVAVLLGAQLIASIIIGTLNTLK